MNSFARRFKQLRENRGWTQEEAADRIGVSRPTIAGYESAEKNRIPREETLHKIADLFDVSIDYLLGRTNDPTRVLKEQARLLIDMIDLDLTDEEIMSNMNLKVDGIEVGDTEIQIFIQLVRAERIRTKLGLSSTENKK